MSKSIILYSGGGSGGHIFPNLAISEAVEQVAPAQTEAQFLVSARDIDKRICDAAGVTYHQIPAAPFSVKPTRALHTARAWRRAAGMSRRIIRRAIEAVGDKARVRVVSTGGFVSAPVARAANSLGVKTTLVNLDASIGLASRLVAMWADARLSPYDLGDRWERIGPIVRAAARAPGDSAHCRGLLGLDPQTRTLVVFGGSQGAATINGAILEMVSSGGSVLEDWQLVVQTGEDKERDWAHEIAQACEARGLSCVSRAFFDEPGVVWGAADVALTRAGAGAVAEAWANRVPSVFVPYPFHKDAHQEKNAAVLVDAGAATLVDDAMDAGQNAAAFGEAVVALWERLDAARDGYEGLGDGDGAVEVAGRLGLGSIE